MAFQRFGKLAPIIALLAPLAGSAAERPSSQQWPPGTVAATVSKSKAATAPSCAIRILPIRGSTHDPLPAGFQFAIDSAPSTGTTPPAYRAPHGPDGGVQFEGSPGIREVRPTPEFVIENPPARFTVLTHVAAFDRLATAIIYRQCFHQPVTTLLMLVNDGDGSVLGWRYAKTGRFSRVSH